MRCKSKLEEINNAVYRYYISEFFKIKNKKDNLLFGEIIISFIVSKVNDCSTDEKKYDYMRKLCYALEKSCSSLEEDLKKAVEYANKTEKQKAYVFERKKKVMENKTHGCIKYIEDNVRHIIDFSWEKERRNFDENLWHELMKKTKSECACVTKAIRGMW